MGLVLTLTPAQPTINTSMVNVLKFQTLFHTFFLLKFCLLSSSFLKYLVEWQTVLTLDLGLHYLHLPLGVRNLRTFTVSVELILIIDIWAIYCLFVLRFYGPVNPIVSCRPCSVYLTTPQLGRLSPLSINQYCQKSGNI